MQNLNMYEVGPSLKPHIQQIHVEINNKYTKLTIVQKKSLIYAQRKNLFELGYCLIC